jgi:hypothetical protein
MFDLHTHSTYSDGERTPRELAREATAAGLSGLALTDHDTVAGVRGFLAACRGTAGSSGGGGLTGIGGVEISARPVSRGTLHMLGYFVGERSAALAALLERTRRGREERNLEIIERLRRLGMPLAREELSARAEGGVVGRLHFARALVARGHARSVRAVFERYLARGRAAYVERYRPEPEEAIAALRADGAPAVLAHPKSLQMGRAALRVLLRRLREAGLAGVEAYHARHSPAEAERYRGLAEELGLVVTGGSDYHGPSNKDAVLGEEGCRAPAAAARELRARAESGAAARNAWFADGESSL